MTYTASDVPARVDVLIAGEGYRFLDTDDVKGISSFAPTFLQRTNVSDAYGDEDQDWWLTMSQNDWSLGEGQRFFVPDEDGRRRYWSGSGVRITRPGRVVLAQGTTAVTINGTPSTPLQEGFGLNSRVYFADGTNLYYLDSGGSDATIGAHGATSPTSIAYDGKVVFISGSSGNLRSYDGASFATFSATASPHLAYLNNTLYGASNTVLRRYSTAGAATTIFTWQSSDGTAIGTTRQIIPYGGDLAIVRTSTTRSELWVYDGVAPALVAQFELGITALRACVLNGALVFACSQVVETGVASCLYVYAGGQLTRLWLSDNIDSSGGTVKTFLDSFGSTVIFSDGVTDEIKQYDSQTGAISSLFTSAADMSSGSPAGICAHQAGFAVVPDSTSSYVWPSGTTLSSGYLITSLFDGTTTRTKRFVSVAVEFDAASDGNGGTVDIAYRLNDPDGSFTSIQAGATSGTEYAIGQAGRAISIKVTLNKGTSTLGPTLKRIYVRAAPLLDTYRKERYVLDLTGVDGEQHIQMRDGITVHPKDGLAMATDLRTAIASTSPITIVDEFGSYSALLVPEECEIRRVRSQEYTAVITARQV